MGITGFYPWVKKMAPGCITTFRTVAEFHKYALENLNKSEKLTTSAEEKSVTNTSASIVISLADAVVPRKMIPVASDANWETKAFSMAPGIGCDPNKLANAYAARLDRTMNEGFICYPVFDGPERVPEKFGTAVFRQKRKLDDVEKLQLTKVMFNEASKIKHDKAVKLLTDSGIPVSGNNTGSTNSITTIDAEDQSILPVDPSLVVLPNELSGSGHKPKLTDEDTKKILAAGGFKASNADNDAKSTGFSKAVNDADSTSSSSTGQIVVKKWAKTLMEKQNFESRIETLERQTESNKLTGAVIEKVRQLLITRGFSCPRSESEGDFVMSHLSKDGHVDYVISDDSDLFVFGVKNVVRNFSDCMRGKKEIEVYNTKKMLQLLKLTPQLLIEICVLAKCDYTHTAVKGIGLVTAYKELIKPAHRTIEKFLLKNPKLKLADKYEDTFPKEAERARKLFNNPRSRDYILSLGHYVHPAFLPDSIVRPIIFSYYQ